MQNLGDLASPRPWRIREGVPHSYGITIDDADGKKVLIVGKAWREGVSDPGADLANAELLIAAVNRLEVGRG